MGQFSLDLSRLVEKAKGRTELVVKKVMLEAFERVVMKSPVDTGRFRANWVASIGEYSRVVSESTDQDGSKTTGDINAAVSAMQLRGQTIYLTNSLPYATRLEYGYSKQAPIGMVRTTLAEITAHYGR